MIEVKVGDSQAISAVEKKEGIFLNNLLFDGEIVRLGQSKFKIYKQQKIFTIEVVERSSKTVRLKIDNQVIEASISNHMDKILESLGMNLSSTNRIKEIKAPMPGSILSIVVNEGEEVKEGDQLLILEAMKMENVIKSPGEGIVSRIYVEEKENVEKNQVLVSFE